MALMSLGRAFVPVSRKGSLVCLRASSDESEQAAMDKIVQQSLYAPAKTEKAPANVGVEEQAAVQGVVQAALFGGIGEVSRRAKDLVRRAERAEQDLKDTQRKYDALQEERQIFMKERDMELLSLERATEQTQKA